MMTILVAIRDFLIATALCWVGVSIETRHQAGAERACAADAQNCD